MVDVGEYFGLLLGRLGENADTSSGASEARPEPVQYRDVKSADFYAGITGRVAPGRDGVGILLTQMLSQVNTARILVPKVAERHEAAALKIRFVSLFQTALGLRKLLEEYEDDRFLQRDAIEELGETLASAQVSEILKDRGLRNTLVHYGVGKRAARRLSPQLPLYGLVQAHVDGKTLAGVTSKVDVGLDHVSRGLRDLLPRIPTPRGPL